MTENCPNCRWITRRLGIDKECDNCQRIRGVAAIEQKRGNERDWYLRTQHCGACGQPGGYCVCTTPCGCHELHEVGSGRDPEAIEQFAASVPDEQEGLF